VFFFSSIVVHELSHAMVARAGGTPVRSITLFALGGVAHIEKEAANSQAELWLGIIGPITSVVVGLACFGVARLLGWEILANPASPAQAMFAWLGYINFTLALFNLIPGFPLDGGRVLRALVWRATGDMNRSTRIAASVGQVAAFGLIALGFLQFFSSANFSGLWLAFIGWFLLDAARLSIAQVEIVTNLRDVRVGDVMSRDCLTVESHADVRTFAEDYLLRTGRRCFLIVSFWEGQNPRLSGEGLSTCAPFP
jgi:Zn-dependent protease